MQRQIQNDLAETDWEPSLNGHIKAEKQAVALGVLTACSEEDDGNSQPATRLRAAS